MGPFNCLGSSSALEEGHRCEVRNDWILGLERRLVGEAFFKIAVCKCYANLQEQICSPF